MTRQTHRAQLAACVQNVVELGVHALLAQRLPALASQCSGSVTMLPRRAVACSQQSGMPDAVAPAPARISIMIPI